MTMGMEIYNIDPKKLVEKRLSGIDERDRKIVEAYCPSL